MHQPQPRVPVPPPRSHRRADRDQPPERGDDRPSDRWRLSPLVQRELAAYRLRRGLPHRQADPR
jgi:hypothetical protein